MTPYEQHQATGHATTRNSPNGIDIIEECETCGARFLFKPSSDCPYSMGPSKDWLCRQRLSRMVGLVYWLNRNRRGWGQVRVIRVGSIYNGEGSVIVEDTEQDTTYPADPKDLRPEYSLTKKQRIACGLVQSSK